MNPSHLSDVSHIRSPSRLISKKYKVVYFYSMLAGTGRRFKSYEELKTDSRNLCLIWFWYVLQFSQITALGPRKMCLRN